MSFYPLFLSSTIYPLWCWAKHSSVCFLPFTFHHIICHLSLICQGAGQDIHLYVFYLYHVLYNLSFILYGVWLDIYLLFFVISLSFILYGTGRTFICLSFIIDFLFIIYHSPVMVLGRACICLRPKHCCRHTKNDIQSNLV